MNHNENIANESPAKTTSPIKTLFSHFPCGYLWKGLQSVLVVTPSSTTSRPPVASREQTNYHEIRHIWQPFPVYLSDFKN